MEHKIKKYKINIPKPSAKRLEQNRKLLIKFCSGWMGDQLLAEHEIPEDVDVFEFNFDREIEYRDNTILDGNYHEFIVLYQNSTGSRKEEIVVSPEEI